MITNKQHIENKFDSMVSRNRVDGLVIIPFRALRRATYMDIENAEIIRVFIIKDNRRYDIKLDIDTLLNDTACDLRMQDEINFINR